MKTKLYLPCLRGVIGNWVYYSALMSAQQIADWVQSAKEIRETPTLDDHLQRTLKERKKSIAEYLQKNDNRFFNSIIIGVFGGVPEWMEFDMSELKALVPDREDINSLKDSMGVLIFDGDEKMFAIDGQHRVAGIHIAINEDSKLPIDLQKLQNDQFSVLFVAHIDDEKGKKRTRRLFSDINKNAKPVSQGDTIIIDEQDPNAIVTRKIYRDYKFFDLGEQILLTEEPNMPHGNVEHFTNHTSLHKAIQIISKRKRRPKPKNAEEEEVLVNRLNDETEDAFNFLIENFDQYRSYFIDKTKTLLKLRGSEKDISFRPVGLFLLVKLYIYFADKGNLDFLKANINKLNFSMPTSPFNRILWNKDKMETSTDKQRLAFDLSLYLLNQFDGKEIELLEQYQKIVKNDDASLPQRIILNG